MEEDSDIIQWHTAFYEAIQLELEEYRDVLTFEIECQLTAASLKVDVVIIKKRKNVYIKKNFARIFQQRNIVEYKSPDDYVSLDDYNKVRSYTLLYASQQHIDTDELSVTFISESKPIKLLKYLAKRYTVKRQQPGIYIVEKDICPLQIIVSRELSDEENLWINGLTKHLTAVRLLRIIKESHLRGKGAAVGAYVDIVSDANDKVFDEVTMGRTLEQVLEQKGFADRFIAKGEARGRAEGRVEGEARGEARGKRDTIVAILRRRFKRVPKALETAIRQLNDPVVLESFAVEAAVCNSLAEFEKGLK
ncbi:hypothetical protein FACS1894170_09730 [Planctomycetales bacterium]|nr:hypothetical protein FACS1894170_09730 [Planctomycetales bacterium]